MINSSISQIHKLCASKSGLELNTLLMQRRDCLSKLSARQKHLSKKFEINPAGIEKEMSHLSRDIKQAELEVSTIAKVIEKNQLKKELNF